MTGLGCNNKDVSEEGCEISCHSQGLLSGCHMGDMYVMYVLCVLCMLCMYVMYVCYVCMLCMYVM